jgi:hypothetical protein
MNEHYIIVIMELDVTNVEEKAWRSADVAMKVVGFNHNLFLLEKQIEKVQCSLFWTNKQQPWSKTENESYEGISGKTYEADVRSE